MMRTTFSLLVILFLLAGSAYADALLLKDGRVVKGSVEKDGNEYQVDSDDGTLWIDKKEVDEWYKGPGDITDKADELVDKGREEWKECEGMEGEEHNKLLRKAITKLEKARDIYWEAREIFDTEQYRDIDNKIRSVVQELRIYRDNYHDLKSEAKGPAKHESWGEKPPEPKKSDEPEPAVDPIPEPVEPREGGLGDPTPFWEEIRKLIEDDELEDAFKVYKEVALEGHANKELRDELVGALKGEAAAQKKIKKSIPWLEKATSLDPSPANMSELRDVHYQIGKDAVYTKRPSFNEGSQSFTAVIRIATMQIQKDPSNPAYYFARARAYYWRGWAVGAKFRGKGGHGQIKRDYSAALTDFDKCLQNNPPAQMRTDAQKDRAEVQKVLASPQMRNKR